MITLYRINATIKTNYSSQIRFLSCSKIYFSSSKNEKNSEVNQFVWKSKPIEQKSPSNLDRNELFKKFSLDNDFSYIKVETPLYILTRSYNIYFIFTVGNFIFWLICANILLAFYSQLDRHEKSIERQRIYEETKHDMKFMDRIQEYMSIYGYKEVLKWSFRFIGIVSSFLFLHLIAKNACFIHLLPGGKQIKVGLLNWRGQPNSKRVYIYDLNDITTREHRQDLGHYITMFVRNRKSTIYIDRQGSFPNPTMFDLTIGINRKL